MIMNHKLSRQQRRYAERQERKDLEKREKAKAQVAIQIKRLTHSVLSPESLDKIAKRTRFIARRRDISANAIVTALMLGCSGCERISSLEQISLYLKKWFTISVKPQSLQAKLNRKESAAFMKEVATSVMMHEANEMMNRLFKKIIKKSKKHHLFERILLQDSTVISLPESVARIFKGCGGSASKAAVKLDVIIDQVSRFVIRMKWVSGIVPDSSLSSDIIKYLKKGDLIIRDLGYFNLNDFSEMIQKKIHFISRLPRKVHIYLTKDAEKPLSIKDLEEMGINKGIDIEIYVGKKTRIPMRLIGIKVPSEVLELRRERHKQTRKTAPSEELDEWNGYTMMITNISKNELNLKQILKMYKVRWQIELFFKNMKSYLHIDKLTGENKYRILVLIYTKIILNWLAALLYAYAQMIVKEGREVSKFKFSDWLQEEFGWKKAFITADFTELIRLLEEDLDFLCKQSTKKQGIWAHDAIHIGRNEIAA